MLSYCKTVFKLLYLVFMLEGLKILSSKIADLYKMSDQLLHVSFFK